MATTPAPPTGAQPNATQQVIKFRKTARGFIKFLTAIFVLGLFTYWITSLRGEQKETANDTTTLEPQIAAPAPAPAPSPTPRVDASPCTSAMHCPAVTEEIIMVPKDRAVCMNPESWEQAKEFGLVVSYGEREMRPWPCTNEQRLAGQCTATYNRFKFSTAPEPQEYWFVEAGAKQC